MSRKKQLVEVEFRGYRVIPVVSLKYKNGETDQVCCFAFIDADDMLYDEENEDYRVPDTEKLIECAEFQNFQDELEEIEEVIDASFMIYEVYSGQEDKLIEEFGVSEEQLQRITDLIFKKV